MKVFKNLYEYRELLKTNVKKEIRGKYKGSFLGVLWSFINPLLMVFVYAIVFSTITKVEMDNFVIYLITGVIPWTFFTTVVQQGMVSVRTNSGLIKKVYFPREILPISVAVSGLINFLISCIIILVFVLAFGVGISWHLVFLPLIALIQFLFSLGLTFALSAINIYVKDTEYIINFVMMMLFYGTPIVYSLQQIPEKFHWILYLNPMTSIIDAYRDVFYLHAVPNLNGLLAIILVSVVVLFVGFKIFDKLQKGFAEEV